MEATKPRYTFTVVIEQEDFIATGQDFGTPQGWENLLFRLLKRNLICAEVVSVKAKRQRMKRVLDRD